MGESIGDETDAYRPLTEQERAILDFLLAADVQGTAELRRQAEGARAQRWHCGCASIDLLVDRTRAPRAPVETRPAIEAHSIEQEDPLGLFDLLLWVDDGWLSAVEIVEYGFERHEDSPDEFPPPSHFEPPVACRRP